MIECARRDAQWGRGRGMEQMLVERRWLLKVGLGGLFGGMLGLNSRAALADVLISDTQTAVEGDGLNASQLRLGELLIRYLAGHSEHRGKGDANEGANVVVSPASIASIFSFVDLGGSNLMHTSIHRMLRFTPGKRSQVRKDLQALRQGVSEIIAQSGKDGPLALANLIAFDRSVNPKQLAMFGLSGAGADVLVDHLQDAKVVDRINDWVKNKTHGLIPSILDEPPETLGLVAINALYFKDKWAIPFEASSTRPEKFQSIGGQPVDVNMMHSKPAKYRFRTDDRFIAAELGYASDNFKLVVVTTLATPAHPQEFATVAGWLDGKGFEERTGEIGMPKFDLAADQELLQPLDTFGLAAARHSPDALEQFSDEPLQISRVVQKVVLHVNEEGTEGAAVTAVVTTRGLGPVEQHVKMIVDKPFIFALRDEKSGLVLFMGYVGAPPKSQA
jgi:serine protease inhibitor